MASAELYRKPFMFFHTVSAAEASAGTLELTIPFAPDGRAFKFVASCMTSAGLDKAGLKYSYSTSTEKITVAKDGTTTLLVENDVISVIGAFAEA